MTGLLIMLWPALVAATTSVLPDPLQAGWGGRAVCEVLQDDARQRITDDSGTREIDLAAGASWSSDGVAWHEVLNVGDTTAVYLIVEPR
jgi:hypothetical protein